MRGGDLSYLLLFLEGIVTKMDICGRINRQKDQNTASLCNELYKTL